MIIASHVDGRLLAYDESCYQFAFAGVPVSISVLKEEDGKGNIIWNMEEQRDWFRQLDEAAFNRAHELAVGASASSMEQPIGAQPVYAQPLVEQQQPAAQPVYEAQPVQPVYYTNAPDSGQSFAQQGAPVPSPEKKKSKTVLIVILCILGALVLCCCCCLAGSFFLADSGALDDAFMETYGMDYQEFLETYDA